MLKFVRVGMTVALLLAPATSVPQQFAKYRQIEAYEVRPHILMMPRYSADGNPCELVLERLHYSPTMIDLDSALSRKEIDDVFNELVPVTERGEKAKDADLMTLFGVAASTTEDFEKITIEISGAVRLEGKHKRIVEDVVATLTWKHRTCQ